ncbi:hypothetical protein DIPPA_06880 [Diplonema papillatum]|nr:hypothetical protein DIPPA_06880 [Diplonema papillatum]
MAADGRGRPATPRAADEQEPHSQRSTVASRGRSPSTPKGKAPRAVSQKLVHSPALQRRSRIAHLRDSPRTSSKPPDATAAAKKVAPRPQHVSRAFISPQPTPSLEDLRKPNEHTPVLTALVAAESTVWCGRADGSIVIHDKSDARKEFAVLTTGHAVAVTAMLFVPGGRDEASIVTGHADGSIQRIDGITATIVVPAIPVHQAAVRALCCVTGERVVVSVSADGTAAASRLKTLEKKFAFAPPAPSAQHQQQHQHHQQEQPQPPPAPTHHAWAADAGCRLAWQSRQMCRNESPAFSPTAGGWKGDGAALGDGGGANVRSGTSQPAPVLPALTCVANGCDRLNVFGGSADGDVIKWATVDGSTLITIRMKQMQVDDLVLRHHTLWAAASSKEALGGSMVVHLDASNLSLLRNIEVDQRVTSLFTHGKDTWGIAAPGPGGRGKLLVWDTHTCELTSERDIDTGGSEGGLFRDSEDGSASCSTQADSWLEPSCSGAVAVRVVMQREEAEVWTVSRGRFLSRIEDNESLAPRWCAEKIEKLEAALKGRGGVAASSRLQYAAQEDKLLEATEKLRQLEIEAARAGQREADLQDQLKQSRTRLVNTETRYSDLRTGIIKLMTQPFRAAHDASKPAPSAFQRPTARVPAQRAVPVQPADVTLSTPTNTPCPQLTQPGEASTQGCVDSPGDPSLVGGIWACDSTARQSASPCRTADSGGCGGASDEEPGGKVAFRDADLLAWAARAAGEPSPAGRERLADAEKEVHALRRTVADLRASLREAAEAAEGGVSPRRGLSGDGTNELLLKEVEGLRREAADLEGQLRAERAEAGRREQAVVEMKLERDAARADAAVRAAESHRAAASVHALETERRRAHDQVQCLTHRADSATSTAARLAAVSFERDDLAKLLLSRAPRPSVASVKFSVFVASVNRHVLLKYLYTWHRFVTTRSYSNRVVIALRCCAERAVRRAVFDVFLAFVERATRQKLARLYEAEDEHAKLRVGSLEEQIVASKLQCADVARALEETAFELKECRLVNQHVCRDYDKLRVEHHKSLAQTGQLRERTALLEADRSKLTILVEKLKQAQKRSNEQLRQATNEIEELQLVRRRT